VTDDRLKAEPCHADARRVKRDEGAIVVNWLTKLVLTLALLGFLAYDGISILATSISASDRANTLASQAADDVKNLKSVQAAYVVIEKQAQSSGDTIRPEDFQVASDGNVTLVLRHTAHSLWMTKFSALKKWTLVKETGEGAPAS
jgi:hypothetical protein